MLWHLLEAIKNTFFASIFRGWVCGVAEKAIVQEIFSSETIARMLSHAAENACAVPRSHWKTPGTMCEAVLWKSFAWEHLLLVEHYWEYLAAHRPLEVKLCYATRWKWNTTSCCSGCTLELLGVTRSSFILLQLWMECSSHVFTSSTRRDCCKLAFLTHHLCTVHLPNQLPLHCLTSHTLHPPRCASSHLPLNSLTCTASSTAFTPTFQLHCTTPYS